MASASYTEDLTCPICLTIFTDPVNLVCGHSFCRECITLSLSSQHQCPQCRATVPTEGNYLLTSHILKSLAEKAKETEKLKNEYRHDKEVAEWLCPEHDEKLKLFCVTDQQLTCVICRDGEKHQGHKFKPIKEAAASLRKELATFMQQVSSDTHAIESQANSQREEITKTKEKSQQLMTQISTQFEEMHQFLRKREDEIKNELKHKEKDAVKKLSKSLNAIETALSESRGLERKLTSVLEITDPERFLKSWTADKTVVTAKHSFRLRGQKVDSTKVENTSVSLGPYESHLQFFMWKEMLQLIKPREELLSLTSNSANITVSDDGRSLCYTPQRSQSQSLCYSGGYKQRNYYDQRVSNQETYISAFSVNKFSSGRHYWEVDVGQRNFWELGVENNFLKYDGQKYVTNQNTGLAFRDRPKKMGIYLNCLSKEMSFYNADNMKHIHTMSYPSMSMSPYFKVAADHNPLTVCWY